MLPNFPAWLPSTLFAISLGAILSIFALSGMAALRRGFQFFPPPSKQSWQHCTFMLLFRCFFYPLLVLTIISFEPVEPDNMALHYGIGGMLLASGFGLALVITLQMGWRNAFGEKRGLVTDGWFKISRNPVYVATLIGIGGWSLIANQTAVTVLLSAWAVLYLLAPLFEEPWLEAQYGAAYRDYKAQTRRFL